MDDIANMRLMVTAGTHQLLSVSDDRWIVLDPSGTTTFDDLIDAIEHLDGGMGSKARIAYHSGLDELIEATELADEDWLFGNSADGLWRIRSTYGTEQLWVPSRAEFAPEEVFTEVGSFGERGYFTHLYRWRNRYLFSWDDGWEDRRCGWEVLGRVSKRDAVKEAVEFANHLLIGVPDDLGLLDDDEDWSEDDDEDWSEDEDEDEDEDSIN